MCEIFSQMLSGRLQFLPSRPRGVVVSYAHGLSLSLEEIMGILNRAELEGDGGRFYVELLSGGGQNYCIECLPVQDFDESLSVDEFELAVASNPEFKAVSDRIALYSRVLEFERCTSCLVRLRGRLQEEKENEPYDMCARCNRVYWNSASDEDVDAMCARNRRNLCRHFREIGFPIFWCVTRRHHRRDYDILHWRARSIFFPSAFTEWKETKSASHLKKNITETYNLDEAPAELKCPTTEDERSTDTLQKLTNILVTSAVYDLVRARVLANPDTTASMKALIEEDRKRVFEYDDKQRLDRMRDLVGIFRSDQLFEFLWSL